MPIHLQASRPTGGQLKEYLSMFRPLLLSHHTGVSDHAAQYLQGLMQESPRKNCERMAEFVPGSDDQAQQQFISASK